ncbi:TerB family tellurite resistance protein [Pelagibacterium xiamenense]|uniref:tellurite resistance TerB family protein n=1 Tax=Pelagibacterium xiamenense TaxID=2901140 RepID=UPI001E3D4DB1|nr:TerB family tellurite resistance protein [Pelagibacterium xiamenense]MCD7058274.1 TerB family tellurite resistance protein [Pelagibacterium xiamenense]
MFDTIARLFRQPDTEPATLQEPEVAVAAVLVHLAAVDGQARPEEFKMISGILQDHYGLSDGDVKKLIEEAKRQDRESVDFYKFTHALTKLEPDEKIAIIRMMWQVVFADDTNHELEDNMVWRVAELIGVSSRDRTILRAQTKRAGTPQGDYPED